VHHSATNNNNNTNKQLRQRTSPSFLAPPPRIPLDCHWIATGLPLDCHWAATGCCCWTVHLCSRFPSAREAESGPAGAKIPPLIPFRAPDLPDLPDLFEPEAEAAPVGLKCATRSMPATRVGAVAATHSHTVTQS